MSSIRETVRPHVPAGYERQAEGAIAALERRERQAVTSIRSAARRAGLSSQQVEEALIQSGLVERPRPTPAAAPTAARGETTEAVTPAWAQRLEQSVNRLGERLDSAARQASRHGISF